MANDITPNFEEQRGNKYPLLLACCLFLLITGLTTLACVTQYRSQTQSILSTQEKELKLGVNNTANAISLWVAAIGEQAKRISSSELFRLFASELAQLDAKSAAILNDPNAASVTLSPEASAYLDQIPLMRNVLLDFMNYNGLQDARIINTTGQVLLSSLTRPTPTIESQIHVAQQAIKTGKTVFSPIRETATGLVVDVADPLQPVLTSGSEAPAGALLLTIPVTGQLAQFLAHERTPTSAIPRLVQKNGPVLELVELYAIINLPEHNGLTFEQKSGDIPFGVRPALTGEGKVYSLGVPTAVPCWWIIQEKSAQQVNDLISSELTVIVGIGLLAEVGFLLLIALFWRISIGREHKKNAERFQSLYRVIQQQKQLLDSVNTSLDVGLFMATPTGEIHICNSAFAEYIQHDEKDIPGKEVQFLFERSIALVLLKRIQEVIEANKAISFELSLPAIKDVPERLLRVTLYPFMENENQLIPQGAVGIMQDITEFRRRSALFQRQQKHTINALTRAIEGIDPYLAGHSHMMEELSSLLAKKLDLSEIDRETLAVASSLSQVGRLFVPRELSTKTGKLTPEEQAIMTHIPDQVNAMLRDIDFGLPVPQAIYEMYERMDGTGYPRKLSGHEISLNAKVLSVLNAFCAMVSPRSYRAGMSKEEALRQLYANPGSYDQVIVTNLDAVLSTPEGEHVLSKEQSA